jgi:hypothetical protein
MMRTTWNQWSTSTAGVRPLQGFDSLNLAVTRSAENVLKLSSVVADAQKMTAFVRPVQPPPIAFTSPDISRQVRAFYDVDSPVRVAAENLAKTTLISHVGAASETARLVKPRFPEIVRANYGVGTVAAVSPQIRPFAWQKHLSTRDIFPSSFRDTFSSNRVLSYPRIHEVFSSSIREIKVGAQLQALSYSLGPVRFPQMSSMAFDIRRFMLPTSPFESLRESARWYEVVEKVEQRWAQNALWFMVSMLTDGQLYRLADAETEEVEAILLDALEAIVAEGTYTQALITTLDKTTSRISSDQREDLVHGLEHAERGDFARALPPLMYGLEGALWSTGREHTILDEQRRLTTKPEKGPIHRIEVVVRKLPGEKSFATFVCGRLFGDIGNPVRHGEPTGNRRRQALFAIVGVAGWMEEYTGAPAREVLGQMLREEID